MAPAPPWAPNAIGPVGPMGAIGSGGYNPPPTPSYGDFGIPSGDARAWGFGQALYNGTAMAGPQFAANQNLADQYNNQIGYQNALYGNQSSYLNANNANDLARLGFKQQSLGVDQLGNARQADYLNTLHGLAGQLFDVQGQRLDLTGQRIDLRGIEAWQQAGQQQRAATSDAVARGANTSIGYNQSLTDIANQLINTGKELDIQKGELGTQRSELGINRQQETADWQEKLASNTDAGKQLDIQAQSLGVDRNQLALDLQHGLDQLGLTRFFNTADLLDKIQGANIQDQILAQQIFNEALKNSDYYAQQYPGPTPAPSTPRYSTGGPRRPI